MGNMSQFNIKKDMWMRTTEPPHPTFLPEISLSKHFSSNLMNWFGVTTQVDKGKGEGSI